MQDRALRLLIILLSMAAAIYLLEKLWFLLRWLKEVLVMLALSWMIAFILDPVVNALASISWTLRRPHLPWSSPPSQIALKIPYPVAVVIVYLILIGLVIAGGTLLLPSAIQQSLQLAAKLPEYLNRAPELAVSLQGFLTRFNIDLNLHTLARSPELARWAQNAGAFLIKWTVGIAGRLATLVAQAFIVFILSFYLMLEQKKLANLVREVVPPSFHDELSLISEALQKTFGAYVRGEGLVALLYGLGVVLLMEVAGLSFALPVGFICGFMTLVPYIGEPIAMFFPAVLALFQRPEVTLWVFLPLVIYQQILVRILLPKIISEATGMPAILVILSILIGVKAMGFLGFILAIPLAGMLYAIGFYILRKYRR
ncbi:MAG: AI-2E family transporter [Anaerolineae bacterium]|nr:AI-2E family transporter [Anaerolineae bacterium]